MARESLLQRAENLYLNILRVLILSVATVSLAFVIYGLISATPLLKGPPSASNEPPKGLQSATLGDFVSEKKAEGTPVGDATNSDTLADTNTVTSSDTVHEAAQNIVAYTKKSTNIDIPLVSVIKEVVANEDTVPTEYKLSYEASLLSLTNQLLVARGTPLTAENIDNILQWHAAKFKAASDAESERETEEKATAVLRLQLGSGPIKSLAEGLAA